MNEIRRDCAENRIRDFNDQSEVLVKALKYNTYLYEKWAAKNCIFRFIVWAVLKGRPME